MRTHEVAYDFAEVSKIVEAVATSKSIKDYELTRYACYLIVQNGAPRKEVIALGQTYFAIQTYRQEIADHFNQLDEDRRRLVVCGDIKHRWHYAGRFTCSGEKYSTDRKRVNEASKG